MVAELFLAVLAVEAGIGGVRESLGAAAQGDLPAEQKQKGQAQQAPGELASDEHEGGEHHGEVPVVDAADGAASVFHEPCLEGTEEKNADHVAHAVGKADKDQDALVDDVQIVEETDGTVERDPHQHNSQRSFPGLQGRLTLPRRLKVSLELLAASHAFQLGREETACHFNGVYGPDDAEQPLILLVAAEEIAGVLDSVDHVDRAGQKQKEGAIDQLDVVEQADRRQFLFRFHSIFLSLRN